MKRVLAVALAIGAYLLVGTMDLQDALISEAEAKARRRAPSAPPTWSFIGEGMSPATLRDCEPGDPISISTNGGSFVAWRRFCYHGRK